MILSSWITSEAIGLEQREYMRLLMMRAPVILYEVLKFCTATLLDGVTCDVDLVEYFCGVASDVRAFKDMGLTAVGYDFLKDPFFMNMLGTAGIVTALMLALRIRNGDGAAWLATVCSSWVWICRSGSKRSSSEPLGDADAAFVQDGNTMTARTGLIMLLMLAKRSWWLLEQPQSSLMSLHPALAYIRSLPLPWCQWHEATTYMGAYSAESMKPTVLWSNRWWVHGLTRERPPASDFEDTQVTTKTIKNCKVQVTGGSGLKKTQAYPDDFGRAFCELFIEMNGTEDVTDDIGHFEERPVDPYAWAELRMDDVMAHIMAPPCESWSRASSSSR